MIWHIHVDIVMVKEKCGAPDVEELEDLTQAKLATIVMEMEPLSVKLVTGLGWSKTNDRPSTKEMSSLRVCVNVIKI